MDTIASRVCFTESLCSATPLEASTGSHPGRTHIKSILDLDVTAERFEIRGPNSRLETAGTVSSDYLEKCITFLLEEFFADARESPLVIDLPPNLDDGENRRPVTYKFELVTISPGGIMRSSSIYWSYVACLFEHPQRLCNALVALSIAIDSLSAGFAVWGIGKHGKNAYEPILWQELFGSDGDRKRAEIEEDRAVCIRERKKAERKVAQQRALRAEEAA